MDYRRILFVLVGLSTCVNPFPRKLLYKHGYGVDQVLPREDDVSSKEILLKTPIVLYGETYNSIYVNSNGLLSFQTEIPTFFNIQFPLNYAVIAPLYTNIDIRQYGTISYRESTSQEDLSRGTRNVRDSFTYATTFQAKSVFIATWSDVGYHNMGADKLNTFQVAIISDGIDSYVEFIYPEKGIQWIQGSGSESGLPDARAQAGIISADGNMYTLPGSGTDRVYNLEKKTNMNAPGQWIFHVGTEKLVEPDTYENYDYDEITTCAQGSNQCHSRARCVDHDEGFCCVCQDNFYGNGKTCIKNDVPLRANGKINGQVNGVHLDNLDLQSYIVMSDGRSYTAISKVPQEIGYSIQTLQILGGLMGLLFAKPIGDTKNGYQLTGGVFNHTATITFNNNARAIIKHHYLGLDVFDQLKMEANVQGNVPKIPDHEKLDLKDFEEIYTVTKPGLIMSQADITFGYGNNNEKVSFKINHNIEYTPCKYAVTADSSTWKLRVSKNYISYESKEQILRFGMSDKVTPLGDIDPCKEGRHQCGPDSVCIVEGDSFTCACNPGYRYIYDDQNRPYCVDINECQVGLHNCHQFAQCVNEPGKFSCRCNLGYVGDGYHCVNRQSCNDMVCPENARCVIADNEAKCHCVPGYIGDGRICVADKRQSCVHINYCSPYALCEINTHTQEYECRCLPGYRGNGFVCQPIYVDVNNTLGETDEHGHDYDYEPEGEDEHKTTTEPSTERPVESHRVPEQCLLGICWCPDGYTKDKGTIYCIPKDEVTTQPIITTTEIEDKDLVSSPVPECYNSNCFCPNGFTYKKSENICVASRNVWHETMGQSGHDISCNIVNNCHPNALCIYDTHVSNYRCQCYAGYEGDGKICYESDISCADSADLCDTAASCVFDEHLKKHICICNHGFQGDGLYCEPTAHQCSAHEDCKDTEDCIFVSSSQRYECACKVGYSRDETGECRSQQETCGGGTCVENAQCLYDEELQTHYCQCNQDYIGDGITECKPRPLGCNVINDCGLHATCVYEQALGMYHCQCNHGYYGDGYICLTQKTCHVDPYICDVHATCVSNVDQQYVCECNEGYTGNGTVCKLSPKHEGNFLLLNQGMATLRVPFEPTPKDMGRPIQIQYYQMAIGLDIDCYDGRVYWSDITGKAIKSSAYNGAEFQDVIQNDIGSPEGISIDWVSRNIYWTDSNKDTLEVASLDTKLRKVLFSDNLVNPRGIAVHPQRGKVFWSDWDRQNPKIEWANMDGTGREIFLKGENVHLPNSLAINWDTDQLCYADAGTKKIECVDIDSRITHTIAINCTYPFGLAISNKHFYWTDWVSQQIESVDKITLKRQNPIKVPLGGSGNKLYAIVAVPEQCPNLTNGCQFYSNQCPKGHICLPGVYGRRNCVCAENCNNH